MERLATDEEERIRLARVATEVARSRYGIDAWCSRMAKILDGNSLERDVLGEA
jgi:hypothetical protein